MKINFHYGIEYDAMLTEMSGKEQDLVQIREVQRFLSKLEKSWNKKEEKVIKSIEKHSKLKFKENITIYVARHMLFNAFSTPLTLRYDKDIKKVEKILIHELIHNLISQNQTKLKKLMAKTYPEEDWSFRIHIPVLLIQKRVFIDIYKKRETEKYIKKDREIFGPEWIEISRIEKKYKGDLVSFLKNENLE